jgi:hypothetical protein
MCKSQNISWYNRRNWEINKRTFRYGIWIWDNRWK